MASLLHGSARTTPRIRAELQAAQAPARALASQYVGLSAAEHPADGTVEQADSVIGQPRRGIQHGRNQSRPATKR